MPYSFFPVERFRGLRLLPEQGEAPGSVSMLNADIARDMTQVGTRGGLVTLGTPVVRWAPWVRTASGIVDGGSRLLGGAAALPRPWAERGSLRVPATSVYTRADGIVDWSSCRYPVRARRENVEVRGSHLGLAYNPAVLWLLADRLGMAEGAWKPFRPPLRLSLFFPRRR